MDRKTKKIKGYLTIYITLMLSVMLLLFLALIENSRYTATVAESECVAAVGVNSILAEYSRELLAQYNLFAIDSSYGTTYPSAENTRIHLKNYICENLELDKVLLSNFLYRNFIAVELKDVQVTHVLNLTDEEGKIFRDRAIEALGDDYNLALFEEIRSWAGKIEYDSSVANNEEQMLEDGALLENQTKQYTEIIGDYVNPKHIVNRVRSIGLLKYVIADSNNISKKEIMAAELISSRKKAKGLNQGNYPEAEKEDLLKKGMEEFLFNEYLMKYMGAYTKSKSDSSFDYQIEYILFGQNNDTENLKLMADYLLALRLVSNMSYIFADQEKYSQAEAVAAAIMLILPAPELEPVIRDSILATWAFVESIYDVKLLFLNKKVPVYKTKETWHYSLEGMMNFNGLNEEDSKDFEVGLKYDDYLRIFLFLQNSNTTTIRAMDVIESDIRMTPGNSSFRLDGCLDRIRALLVFETKYGYKYQTDVEASY